MKFEGNYQIEIIINYKLNTKHKNVPEKLEFLILPFIERFSFSYSSIYLFIMIQGYDSL